jgi:uncharacterized protein (TIGR01777 family)
MRYHVKCNCFVRRTRIAAPAVEVFRWHARPGALERLTPPWEPVEVLEHTGGIEDGSRVVLGVRTGPLCLRWVAEHRDYEEGRQFCDVQVSGPFARWEHRHRVEPDGPDACFLEDEITYALPFGSLGHRFGGAWVRQKLDSLFAYRHRITSQDIDTHRAYGPHSPQHVLVTGSNGLVGSALVPFLTTGGHRVTRLVRSAPRPDHDEIAWDPAAARIAAAPLEGLDAVVHLAGENIAAGRWNAAKKARIRDSRVQGTRLLCNTLAQLDRPPRVLVCASAIGYYGSRGDTWLREDSVAGTDSLAEVCEAWEAAAEPARQRGIRVVHLRFGVILSPSGGALATMLVPFKLGAGGVIGNGQQYLSWVALDDVVGAAYHALMTDTLQGPVNVVSSQPVTNREYTQVLGRVLRRLTLLPLPAFAARLAFGEMAEALFLASSRVEPARLIDSGYVFRYPELATALQHQLGKSTSAT